MFEPWLPFREIEIERLIVESKDAERMQRLAKRLRELADAADARAVELTLDSESFCMPNATERVQ